MKKIFFLLAAHVLLYGNVVGQPPVKKLVYKGYKYEYEREKREGEIILSGTYPEAITKQYKQFRSDSIRTMQDSLNKQNTKKVHNK